MWRTTVYITLNGSFLYHIAHFELLGHKSDKCRTWDRHNSRFCISFIFSNDLVGWARISYTILVLQRALEPMFFWHQFKCAGSEEIPVKKNWRKKKRKENKPIQQNAKQTTSRHLHTIDRESRKKNTNNMNTAKKICWKKNGIVIVSTVFKA